ncbi:MAG: hypothetical protein JO332_16900 [Planctomycetaceae bacterium]|nr:hypothetical protein [Planctomycetaceae bacterium]
MKTEPMMTEILEVKYAERRSIQPFLDTLCKDGVLSATLLRGRVTTDEAWYKVAVSGPPNAVCAALHGRPRGADRFSRLVPAVA